MSETSSYIFLLINLLISPFKIGDWHCAYLLLYGPRILEIPETENEQSSWKKKNSHLTFVLFTIDSAFPFMECLILYILLKHCHRFLIQLHSFPITNCNLCLKSKLCCIICWNRFCYLGLVLFSFLEIFSQCKKL